MILSVSQCRGVRQASSKSTGDVASVPLHDVTLQPAARPLLQGIAMQCLPCFEMSMQGISS